MALAYEFTFWHFIFFTSSTYSAYIYTLLMSWYVFNGILQGTAQMICYEVSIARHPTVCSRIMYQQCSPLLHERLYDTYVTALSIFQAKKCN